MATSDASTADREIVIERTVNAPRELVWQAWTEADQIRQWWGPNGFTTTIHAMDVRVGGVWRFIMHGPDGTNWDNHNQFVEIRKPELIVIDHLEEPLFRVTASFTEKDGKTHMTFRQVFDTAETLERVKPYAVPGSEQTLGKLARHVESRRR